MAGRGSGVGRRAAPFFFCCFFDGVETAEVEATAMMAAGRALSRRSLKE